MSLKIVFMGTPEFSIPSLKILKSSRHKIISVYTQPPKKSQIWMTVRPSPIQNLSETLNIECRTPFSLTNNQIEYDYIKKLDADLAIVVGYGQILSKELLGLAKNGFINIHASLLPKWRGAAPIQRSIMNLDNEIGISIMKIVEELDSGPVSNIY